MTDNATIQAAAQQRIGHALELAKIDGNYLGLCKCTHWAKESVGVDETSKSAVTWGYERHEGEEV
jgi:hypothetical protein